MHHHVHVGIVGVEGILGRHYFGTAHVVVVMQDLALEVGDLHHVEVHDADGAHAGEGQIDGGGRSQAAGADYQDLGVHELALTKTAHLAHDDVPAVTLDLLGSQSPCLCHLISSVYLFLFVLHESGVVCIRSNNRILRCWTGCDRQLMR